LPISTITLKEKTFRLSYKIHHLDKLTDIIILHGWGSNKEIMEKSFSQQIAFKEYRLIFIDLPGFGKSNNEYILNTLDYAHILHLFFKKIKIKNHIIIGHSFGGKIATLLNPKMIVLLSSAGIVPKKALKIVFKIYLFKMLKKIGFGFLYKLFVSKDVNKMSQSMYETFKNVVDEKFDKHFQDFKNIALIFWGKDDLSTPISSGEKIHSLIKNSHFDILKGEHFFFSDTKNSSFIASKIRDVWIKR
jgi:pimeloyl-ACP methyl ester carboxylesterase